MHAGCCYNRFQVGLDGKTPYMRTRGKIFNNSICEFGESEFYRVPKRIIGPELRKWDDQWASGIFLGIKPTSNEAYVGTSSGVLRCRSVRRKPVKDR